MQCRDRAGLEREVVQSDRVLVLCVISFYISSYGEPIWPH